MTTHNLYRAVWYWKDDHLAYQSLNEGKEKAKLSRATQDLPSDTTINFLENVDKNCQKFYKQKYQRSVKPNVPIVVTIQDIKDVVTYLLVGNIPKSVMSLFHSYEINPLLRALIAYMQLYLQVWEDLSYRRAAYSTQMRLKHPISREREHRCRQNLSKLRCRIGQEYARAVAGEGCFNRYHHMNNSINRSYVAKDLALYEYLFKLVPRVVWIALGRRNYREIDVELARLFRAPSASDSVRKRPRAASELAESSSRKLTLLISKVADLTHADDLKVLQSDLKSSTAKSKWHQSSPVAEAIFSHRDDPDFLLAKNLNSPGFEGTHLSGLEAAITLPEELFQRFGVSVGILGLPRDNFEAMLHPKQEAPKTLEEEEVERARASIQSQAEKPKVKMYEYLRQLESIVDLTGDDEGSGKIKDKIDAYFQNHVEDSVHSCSLWKRLKCFLM